MFVTLRWTGAAYLCWLGGNMLIRPATTSAPPAPRAVSGALTRGFLVQATNPAALAYFAALLPQFVDPHARVGRQVFVLGASATVIELAVLALYVHVAGRVRTFAGAGHARTLERVGGAVLLGIGLRLALARLA
jgi:threonine/homoserine/homoserine lactone efflux protein